MKSVKRTVMAAGAMLMAVGAAISQAPMVLRSAVVITEMPPAPLAPRAKSPDAAIERLMSFDGNGDHRISRDELPERIQVVVARGDRNANAALESDEIRSLVHAACSERIRVAFRSQSSEGLPGVSKDLKLPPATHALALGIVSLHKLPRRVNDSATSDLYGKIRALLDDEEYENFVAAATRLFRTPHIIALR